MIRWSMVPIGQVDANKKYSTACSPAYQSYNECLRKTLFDRDECKAKLSEVISCQKVNDLYETVKKLSILKSFKKRKLKK